MAEQEPTSPKRDAEPKLWPGDTTQLQRPSDAALRDVFPELERDEYKRPSL